MHRAFEWFENDWKNKKNAASEAKLIFLCSESMPSYRIPESRWEREKIHAICRTNHSLIGRVIGYVSRRKHWIIQTIRVILARTHSYLT